MTHGSVPRSVGRYTFVRELAGGGMATVFLGRLNGPGGFQHKLAIKRLHAHFAKDPEFVTMFLDEARIASHVQHANVIQVFEVLLEGGELFMVMEYVRGETLANLIALANAKHEPIKLSIALGMAVGALAGLHAAHEARDDAQKPLEIVHRDVSPQNILVGVDGVARILDFGIARAVSRLHTTHKGQIKGKPAYMAPEQRTTGKVDRRADIYAMGVVLWEMLTGKRLFGKGGDGVVVPPSAIAGSAIPPAIDSAVLKALAPQADERFATARELAIALEQERVASPREIGEWVEPLALAAQTESADREPATAFDGDETAAAPPPSGSPVRTSSASAGRLEAAAARTPKWERLAWVVIGLLVVGAVVVWLALTYGVGRPANG